MPGPAQSGIIRNETFAVEIIKAVVHERHAFFAPRLDRVLQLMQIVFTDQIADGAVRHNQFVRQHAAGTVGRRQQFLRDDTLQRIG